MSSIVAVVVLLAVYLAVLEYSRPHVSGDRVRVDTFTSLAERGRLKSARILDSDATVVGSYVGTGGSVRQYYLPYFKSETLREQLSSLLVTNRVPTTVDQQWAKGLVLPATLLLPALILVVVMVYLILAYRRGTGLFSIRSGARRAEAEDSRVTFDDVAGQDAAVGELREVSDFLTDPERFAAIGVQVPKGILLYGPTGCGKTLLARALAGTAGASFYSISGSDFVELYVGVGASRVRELFKEARENAPAIVFIDELDSVGRRRRGGEAASAGSHQEQEQALNQILTEMDGFSPTQGIIVLGATNRPDVLDSALLRPGRFDRAIGLEIPDEAGRRAILEIHARGKPLAPGVDLGAIAHQAVGMTGADLASVVNEAGLQTARAGHEALSQADLAAALERVAEAPERQRRLSMRDRNVGQRSLAGERVTFADVAGAPEAIEELAEVRHYLAEPERFAALGARIPRGYLLVGPPGCGKTLLARAVAGESNAGFLAVAATEFVEVYVGEGAGRVRDLFAQAQAVAPAIVFIDEIDAVGGHRGAAPGGQRESDQTLNQILVELDGFRGRPGVIVIAASNRPDILDPALIRPGRFDRTITLDLPDRAARVAILELHGAGKPLGADVDLDAVAGLTSGLAGADLASVMNEAALLAGRRGEHAISMGIVDEAIERAGMGIARSRIVSEEERRMVAYHEAGHGLVARALPGGKVLHKLTIVPRGRSLGTTWLPEAGDQLIHSRSLLIERMATLLGGRVADEIVFGEPTSGAARDLMQVTEIASRMVVELGMSDAVGALSYTDAAAHDGRSPYSEETARLIDSEARALVQEAERLAHEVLTASRTALDRVADALLERETLTLAQVDEIAGEAPAVAHGARNGRRRPAALP